MINVIIYKSGKFLVKLNNAGFKHKSKVEGNFIGCLYLNITLCNNKYYIEAIFI